MTPPGLNRGDGEGTELVSPDFATIYSDARAAMMNDMTGQDIDHHLVIAAFAAGRQAQHAWNARSLPQAGEGVERLVREAYEEGVEDGVDWCREASTEDPFPQWIDSVARVNVLTASLPPAGRAEGPTDAMIEAGCEAMQKIHVAMRDRNLSDEPESMDDFDEGDVCRAVYVAMTRTALTGKVHP